MKGGSDPTHWHTGFSFSWKLNFTERVVVVMFTDQTNQTNKQTFTPELNISLLWLVKFDWTLCCLQESRLLIDSFSWRLSANWLISAKLWHVSLKHQHQPWSRKVAQQTDKITQTLSRLIWLKKKLPALKSQKTKTSASLHRSAVLSSDTSNRVTFWPITDKGRSRLRQKFSWEFLFFFFKRGSALRAVI